MCEFDRAPLVVVAMELVGCGPEQVRDVHGPRMIRGARAPSVKP